MRIVFMGTPEYACPSLEKLHQAHEIVMVYSQPDRPKGRGYQLQASPIKQLALELGLPVHQPESLRLEDEAIFLRALAPDVVVVIAYGILLPQSILDIPRLGCINAHGSLLPKHRGASPMQQAILDGDDITGVTTMLMDRGMDTGDMLLKQATALDSKTVGELHDELAVMSADLLLETLQKIEQIVPEPQDDTKASYTAKITRQDGIVDWQLSADELVRHWRAFHPWPGLTTSLMKTPLKLIEINVQSGERAAPGTVIATSEEGIDIATGEGVIRITRLQPPGKRAMSAADYLRGNPLEIGERLGE